MAASLARRQKRFEQRQSVKMFKKIRQQTLDEINKQSPEERDKLLKLYQHMLEQKEIDKKQKEDGM